MVPSLISVRGWTVANGRLPAANLPQQSFMCRLRPAGSPRSPDEPTIALRELF